MLDVHECFVAVALGRNRVDMLDVVGPVVLVDDEQGEVERPVNPDLRFGQS